MNYNLFFNKIDICDSDKEKAKHYLEVRGVREHIFVADYIQSFKPNKVTYAEIATTFRYDKRIRRIIFKYLGFLEEYLRAYIINNYENDLKKLNLASTLDALYRLSENFYEAVNQLTFGQLIGQVKKLSSLDKNNLFDVDVKNKNLDALVGLRNEVNHNRFLLHNKSLRQCTVGDNSGRSLWANIINLGNHLKQQIKDDFLKEIENSRYEGINKRSNQVEWNLNKNIVIKV